jgi:DNA-binding NtrC family response regulator
MLVYGVKHGQTKRRKIMVEREILLADRDSEVRRQVADAFRKEGYQVETTDSAVHVFCAVLEKKIPVVLLGSDFDKKINLPDLVRLLKKCNRQLTIILVSDEQSLPLVRTIREEGIFYHALKPANRNDTEEIRLAVKCAFDRPETN